MKIGLIKEGKFPPDNRVALAPSQCRWISRHRPDIQVCVEPSPSRCFTDAEYQKAGATLLNDLADCDVLMGIKEVPVSELIANKTYCFFSHTKKKQPHNRDMLRAILEKSITLIDYECLEHEDGQRIIGFGFFAGVVGAHNGMMAYGKRTGAFALEKVHEHKSFRTLIHTYFGLRLPPVKIAVTGSGRVASGILEIMNLMGVIEVEPDEFLEKEFRYPVYVHLKGADLYRHKVTDTYNRNNFHNHPEEYRCIFPQYIEHTDLLMNGIYWDNNVPRLFEWEHLNQESFRIQTIADITDDFNGSIPCNIGDASIKDPVYGVNRISREKTQPYVSGSVDLMAVSNLPNELPRDASRYFGEQLLKFVIDDLQKKSDTIRRATIVENGQLTDGFRYLEDYVRV
jgi:saccharopine dehydrogenase (NAD+, L-lysine-forming)